MKRVTASEARKNWFRILDEVAGGEVVVIERNGKAIQLTREPRADRVREVPDYTRLLRAPGGAEHAERWGWDWSDEDEEVRPVEDAAQ